MSHDSLTQTTKARSFGATPHLDGVSAAHEAEGSVSEKPALLAARVEHFRRPTERPFLRSERERVTCLFGGLTYRHERLMEASFQGMGYRAARIPTPTKADYDTGRECCSPGMCNPVYFTVGALVNYLKRLRDIEGLTVGQILDGYVFVTTGSCGPCRFGMYESEFRLALRNSGFDGFRVVVFQQKAGANQSSRDDGIEVNAEFARRLVTALMIGDLLNDLAHQIRPYEVNPGETECVLEEALERVCTFLRLERTGGRGAKCEVQSARCDVLGVHRGILRDWGGVLLQVIRNRYGRVLGECMQLIDGIGVDYTRPRALCKVTGEFWAQMTEGDGNFGMFSFVESQGGEVMVEPITTWAVYLLDSAIRRTREVRSAKCGVRSAERWRRFRIVYNLRGWIVYLRKVAMLKTVSYLIRREYERMRRALGGMPHPLASMSELRELARPFFNDRITGGEGHMEVGKTLYYSVKGLSHMVLSLKPFGCLPSTQSDGVQRAALSYYGRQGYDILFLPVETSGEGEIGARGRVLMALEQAKARCEREFEACVEKTGYAVEDLRGYCACHGELRRPFQRVCKRKGIVGRAANFVLNIASRMDTERDRRSLERAGVDAAIRARSG